MQVHSVTLEPYQFALTTGQSRQGALLRIVDEKGAKGVGDLAPLPGTSRETLEEALQQLTQKKSEIMGMQWSALSVFDQLKQLELLPSLCFALESALLALLDPIPAGAVATSALLMGSVEEIISLALLREQEGFVAAKLKVGHLSFEEAAYVIHQLKHKFHLRIDVNRAWDTSDSLRFFSQFGFDAFDYVEEPFKNPHDLKYFTHPLAVDESFPNNLTLEEVGSLPLLKALIYKPTIQGGAVALLPLIEFAKQRKIALILSSSFESDVGLECIASLAQRFSLSHPIGIGTYHYIRRN